MSDSPAFLTAHPEVAAWRHTFLSLKPGVPPCPGLAGAKWQAVHAAAVAFLDHYAEEAAGYGWTTLELFGVHPTLGVLRSDYCGALVLSGETASGIEPDRILFQRTHYRRNVPGQPTDGVALWAFKGGRWL
ncbi:hypothetical protein [Methylobacterium iners]|uniref:Uncharacterized protein n=1 Tax=Methylobacterium iners TaxID=418707 RepID=A0ABQ4RWD7_9HYPH|nr:hypothetical protein [Methylobacterium iners]GJD93978.1 hypothetical protein OCOJLMKI_1176 [Methylobacterium iners]